MNARKSWLLLGRFPCILAECWTSDVSHQEIFRGAVGAQLVTKRETFLFHWKDYEAVPEFRKTAVLEDLSSEIPASTGKVLMSPARAEFHIPRGQPIRVLRIEKRPGDGSVDYEAIGEVYVPSLRRFLAFRYSRGFMDKVWRAPWEANDVPVVRHFPSLL